MLFLAIGVVGLVLLLAGLFVGDVFDGVLPEGDWFSLAGLAGALFAFGATVFVLQQLSDLPQPLNLAIGAGTSLLSLVTMARLGGAIASMATDATPQDSDMVGTLGRVVTPVAAGSLGEVLISLGGQPIKVNARSADGEAIARGEEVIVVEVRSSSMVLVQQADLTWTDPPLEPPGPAGQLDDPAGSGT